MPHKKPLTVATRNTTLRDFAIFQVKLLLDGAIDVFAFWVSIGAIIIDFIAGRGKRPRLFYSVVRMSERFDKWINLHGAIERMDQAESEDGLFGVSEPDDDNLVTEIEKLVQKVKNPVGRVRPPAEPQ